MADLLLLIKLFPYDPAIDGPLGHLHLMLIYGITWFVHVAYVAFIVIRPKMNSRSNGQ